MDPEVLGRVAVPLLLVAFVATLLVWPVRRLRRETGAQAITLHRDDTRGQRVGAVAFLAVQVGVALLAVAYVLGGPGAVGAWTVPATFVWSGIGLGVAGLVLVAVAQRQMGASLRIGIDAQATPLVERGLFRLVRNPIFSGILVMLAGVVLIREAWILCGLGIAWFAMAPLAEEP